MALFLDTGQMVFAILCSRGCLRLVVLPLVLLPLLVVLLLLLLPPAVQLVRLLVLRAPLPAWKWASPSPALLRPLLASAPRRCSWRVGTVLTLLQFHRLPTQRCGPPLGLACTGHVRSREPSTR